jgi:hypothetical protein
VNRCFKTASGLVLGLAVLDGQADQRNLLSDDPVEEGSRKLRDSTDGAGRQDRRRHGDEPDATTLSPEMKAAIEHGMADAWADFARGAS